VRAMPGQERVYCSTTLRRVCEAVVEVVEASEDVALLEDGAEAGLARKLVHRGEEDAPVFYDMLQSREEGLPLYPCESEYSAELERDLVTLCEGVRREVLAAAVEIVAREQAVARKNASSHAVYVDLARDSRRWEFVEHACGEHLEVVRVQAVENEFLRDQYESFKRRMSKKPGFTGVNEKWLFHGTGKTQPDVVCLGTEGFDPRCARNGNYGVGSYFSTTPNYSAKHYANPFPIGFDNGFNLPENQIRQFLIARVACGNVADLGKSVNQRLKRPPPLSSSGHVLYDSVMGGPFSSRSSEMHMVVTYDKAQAMPEYLITFRAKPTFEDANRSTRVTSLPSSFTPSPFNSFGSILDIPVIPPTVPSFSSTGTAQQWQQQCKQSLQSFKNSWNLDSSREEEQQQSKRRKRKRSFLLRSNSAMPAISNVKVSSPTVVPNTSAVEASSSPITISNRQKYSDASIPDLSTMKISPSSMEVCSKRRQFASGRSKSERIQPTTFS